MTNKDKLLYVTTGLLSAAEVKKYLTETVIPAIQEDSRAPEELKALDPKSITIIISITTI